MNLKHEMFWNMLGYRVTDEAKLMNLKHEMFWNLDLTKLNEVDAEMNLKHEMFWNEVNAERIVLSAYEP